ncbi:hypothetical protein ADK38_24420, partial [Streptomyces varsoviensis]
MSRESAARPYATPHAPYAPHAPYVVAVLYCAAGALAAVSLAGTLRSGITDPHVALAFGGLIAVGELARQGAGAHPGDREPAPLAAAGALAYALLGETDRHPTSHGALQVLAVVLAATLAGAAPR